MGPVAVVTRAGMRQRWPALVALTLVLGLTGAVVLATAAGSRRGRAVLEEFVTFHQPGNIEAYVDPSLPFERQAALSGELAAIGGPTFVQEAFVIVALPGPDGVGGDGTDVTVGGARLAPISDEQARRPFVLDGAISDEPRSVAVNDRLAQRRGIEVGDEIDLALFDAAAIDQVGGGDLDAPHQLVGVTVRAIFRTPFDLARSPAAQPGTVFEADEGRLLLSPDITADYGAEVASYGIGVAGEVPADELDRVAADLRAVGDEVLVNPTGPEDLAKLGPVGDAIDLEANALLAFAALTLVFGIGVLGAALARVTREDAADHQMLLALGFTRREALTPRLLMTVFVSVAAAVLAAAGAAATSGRFPIGLARDADITPGADLDTLVLGAGALVFVALLLARVALAGLGGGVGHGVTTTRLSLRPLGLGARRVVGDLRGGGSRVALGTAVVGVVAVTAGVTFAASLDHLAGDPALQGWTWDLVVGNYSEPGAAQAGRRALEANEDVAAISGYQFTAVPIDGDLTTLMVFDRSATGLVPFVLEGRAPFAADEIALGRQTLAELDRSIGDTVVIEGEGPDARVEATIVGIVVAPATLAFGMDLDSGATGTFGLEDALFGATAQGPTVPQSHLVDLADGVDPVAAAERLRDDFPGTVLGPMKPLDLGDLERVRALPYLLAGLLGAVALVSVVVGLAAGGRRRRREVAVVRSLGLARDQLRALFAGEATTFLGLALLAGIPMGVVVGRLAWTLAADGLGSEVGPVVPLLGISLAVLGLLILVNLYGQGLAQVVNRRHPGTDLRSE